MSDVAEPASRLVCPRIARVEVHKAERRLRALCDDGSTLELSAALGRGGPEPKRRENDARTPEGRYRVSGPARTSRFHLFIPIDYPAVEDARRALEEGRISGADHARILDAHRRGEPPPGDTPLGGAIGLHGRGARWSDVGPEVDWTLGCIAVSDDEIELLAARVEEGTPVEILP